MSIETCATSRQYLIDLQAQIKRDINHIDEEINIFCACKQAQRECLTRLYESIEKHFKDSYGWDEETLIGN